jgi:hypothetical protein
MLAPVLIGRVGFTMKQCVQTDLEADRQPADEHAYVNDHQRSLTSFEITRSAREDQAATVDARARETARTSARFTNPVYKPQARGPLPVRKRPLALVAGEGFEPSTFGL